MSREVAVVDVGQTTFGKHDRGIRELGAEAAKSVLENADSLSRSDIDAAYVGNAGTPADYQHMLVGQYCLREVGLEDISIMNFENACSSSASAFQQAYRDIAAGFIDVALVLGVEKMTGLSTEEATEGLAVAADVRREMRRGFTFPGKYGMLYRAYEAEFGSENLREALTKISVKNHHNGSMNPNAQFQKEVSEEEVIESPLIADPIRLLDMSPISDGGAAIIIAATDALEDDALPEAPITVEASVHMTGDYDEHFAKASGAEMTANRAYEQAGVTAEDVDFFEVHDASTFAELQRIEAIGVCGYGEGAEYVVEGNTELTGPTPVNPSGGLKSRGHPVGATGVAQLNEIVWQLRGEAGGRQVKDATIGLSLNTGGALNGVTANNTVHILQRS